MSKFLSRSRKNLNYFLPKNVPHLKKFSRYFTRMPQFGKPFLKIFCSFNFSLLVRCSYQNVWGFHIKSIAFIALIHFSTLLSSPKIYKLLLFYILHSSIEMQNNNLIIECETNRQYFYILQSYVSSAFTVNNSILAYIFSDRIAIIFA